MTRSHRNDVPLRTSSLDQMKAHMNSNPDAQSGPKENEPKVHRTTPWTLNATGARPCRASRSIGTARGDETMRAEQCSWRASTYHSMEADATDAVATDAVITNVRAKIRQSVVAHTTGPYDQTSVSQTSRRDKIIPVDVESYTQPFLSFISENPTTFHAVATVCKRLESQGFTVLSERDSWANKLSRGGKYCFTRNGSSVIAFVVGDNYESGNGASVIASHIDALTTRVKPIPTLPTKAGYLQLGVAPYAGALNNTWWDRDLGIGGRVLVKDSKTGKIETKLVKLGWPIARIPTLAPHFGAAADLSHPNKETEMVPIIGLDYADSKDDLSQKRQDPNFLGGAGTFTATQPERLVKAIAGEMNIQDCKRFCPHTYLLTNFN